MLKSKVILGCAALVGVICTSSFLSYAKNDDTAITETVTENSDNEAVTENPDYGEILAPYENIFDEFNNSHGTNYGFMTDEQLERAGKSREEYEKEMVEEYGSMTPEEFEAFLDEAYSKDQEFLAEMEAYGAHPADDAEVTETVAENSDTEKKLSPQNLPYYQKEEPENKDKEISCKDNFYGIELLKD